MNPYHFARWTRSTIVPSIADLTAPTLAEVTAGVEINGDTLLAGLDVARTTESVDAGLWHSDIHGTRPGRYAFSSPTLRGRRAKAGSTEPLWSLAVYRARGFLVVRRGVLATDAWGSGDVVETLDFRYGKRTVIASADTAVTFEVPLFVTGECDQAVIDAEGGGGGEPGLLSVDDETGAPIDDEFSDEILAESSA